MEKIKMAGYTGTVAQVVIDSLPLAAAFSAYSMADDARKGTYTKAVMAVGVGILANILTGYVKRNVVDFNTISGLTLERVGALSMPQLRTRTNQRQGYGALTLERVSGCAGCGY
jgi:hypothetical protein